MAYKVGLYAVGLTPYESLNPYPGASLSGKLVPYNWFGTFAFVDFPISVQVGPEAIVTVNGSSF